MTAVKEERALLRRVHELRMRKHWGKSYDPSHDAWPQTDADWRQTPHGAPWDTNVTMARWHLEFAWLLQKEDLL